MLVHCRTRIGFTFFTSIFELSVYTFVSSNHPFCGESIELSSPFKYINCITIVGNIWLWPYNCL